MTLTATLLFACCMWAFGWNPPSGALSSFYIGQKGQEIWWGATYGNSLSRAIPPGACVYVQITDSHNIPVGPKSNEWCPTAPVANPPTDVNVL